MTTTMEDIEDMHKRLSAKYEKIFAPETASYGKLQEGDLDKYKNMVEHILNLPLNKIKTFEPHKYKQSQGLFVKNSILFQTYLGLVARGDFPNSKEDQQKLADALKIKKGKSTSGVIVITVFTSPYPEYTKPDGTRAKQSFSCAFNCAYCPNEPNMPRSYLALEPGCMRAKRADFDCVTQMHDRMSSLYACGHISMDKLEVLVLGGTWTSYPQEYRKEFCRDIYYAANTFFDLSPRRLPLSLQEEKSLNKSSLVKVIGLTLETRPDTITDTEIIRFREYGCTRVQLGVQHTDNSVLQAVNRGCTREDAVIALEKLKDAGFKVDTHFMPNLPTSTPKLDETMFVDELLAAPPPHRSFDKKTNIHWEHWSLRYPDIQSDQWKIYPTMVTPWTKIEEMYRAGTYVPYPIEDLYDVILKAKSLMFPWIRINRLIRDISGDYFVDHVSKEIGHMRVSLENQLKQETGQTCQCIRCRQINDEQWDGRYVVRVRTFDASNGKEYFIAAESEDAKVLYGFVRLRFPSRRHISNSPFESLTHLALIRELHVYGQVSVVDRNESNVQHRGIGKRLMAVAEDIAKSDKWRGLAVISGEGVRGYYEKLGFKEDTRPGWYMIKEFPKN